MLHKDNCVCCCQIQPQAPHCHNHTIDMPLQLLKTRTKFTCRHFFLKELLSSNWTIAWDPSIGTTQHTTLFFLDVTYCSICTALKLYSTHVKIQTCTPFYHPNQVGFQTCFKLCEKISNKVWFPQFSAVVLPVSCGYSALTMRGEEEDINGGVGIECFDNVKTFFCLHGTI
jgi:hypothetical protein